MSSLQKTILKSRLPPYDLHLPTSSTRAEKARSMQRKRDYEPVPWTAYFETSEDVKVAVETFHIYRTGSKGPTLVLLHGGGYGALSWAEFTKSITAMVVCKVIAVDLRGHGDTHTTNDANLEIHALAMDVWELIREVAPEESIILLGHSMGGAVAVKAAPLLENLAGLAVIDVVEGTAMESLASMQSFLRSRPTTFSSVTQAIQWCIESGKLATHEIEDLLKNLNIEEDQTDKPIVHCDVIPEETASMPPPAKSNNSDKKKYTWRIDLAKTERFWSGWFEGLSAAFLNIASPKMLLLAGVDRLDRKLTVGQMQGKFQMHVLPDCGHAVHEDVPDKVAEAIATFLNVSGLLEQTAQPRLYPRATIDLSQDYWNSEVKSYANPA